jgi:hypothetical protein
MQLLWVIAALPFMVMYGGLAWGEVLPYFATGVQILLGQSGTVRSALEACAPLFYFAINIAFNFTATTSLKVAGSVTTSLFMTASVPIAIWAFTCIPWPLLGPAPPLGAAFVVGATILTLGMLLYNLNPEFSVSELDNKVLRSKLLMPLTALSELGKSSF